MNPFSLQTKLLLAGGLLLALLAGTWWIYAKGRDAGKAQQKEEMVEEVKRQTQDILKQAEVQYQQAVTASEQAVEAARQERRSSEARESRLLSTLQSLSQQRSDSLRAVGQVQDSQLHATVVSTLGIRSPTDNVPVSSCYLPSEERRLLEVLTDYKGCEQTSAAQGQQIQEVKSQVETFRTELSEMRKQLEAERQLRTRYSEAYVTIYNAFPTKKRGWKCMKLWSCSKSPPLPVPSPEALAKPAS